ncbi:MAG: DUF2332 domain-containing protein [Microthrixaceae bacterium]
MPEDAAGEVSSAEARKEWAGRFDAQSVACHQLGSALYGRLLEIIAGDIRADGPSWEVLSGNAGLRFGQAGPLRLVGAAHRMAISGAAPGWASMLPSCGGTAPTDDSTLRDAWLSLVAAHGDELRAGLGREVQTNEVGRSAGLGLGLASTGFATCRLIELGCSGGLNLRLDRFAIDLGELVLGDSESDLRVAPDMGGSDMGGSGAIASAAVAGPDPLLELPMITDRIGIDPHPIDATTEEGRWTLSSFVWPDQVARFERLTAALRIAGECPASLVRTDDTVGALADALAVDGARVVQHSIVWQYIPTAVRWKITATIESAGRNATDESPLAWVRYEPDEWDRSRAAIWLRTWPGGADRLIAHVDYHGRWLEPIPAANG